jgi:hypothetical protein
MKRFLTILLIGILWLSTGGFASAALESSRMAPAPTLQTALEFGKIYPPDNATNVPAVSLTLEWEPLEDAGEVVYFYCLTERPKCAPGRWIRVGDATSVTVSNLKPDQKYNWWVNAYPAEGRIDIKAPIASADNGPWSFTTRNLPGSFTKSAPVNGASGLNPASVPLSWTTSAGAESYEYCVDATNNDECDDEWVATGSVASATVTGLYNNSYYYWQVRAVNPAGYTYANNTAWWSFGTEVIGDLFVKLAPADQATGVTASNPMLTWSVSQGATSYQYCLGLASEPCENWIPTGTSTFVSVGTLAYDTAYQWQVQAMYPAGPTPASGGWWQFTTQYGPPAAFTRIAPGHLSTGVSTSPVLSWNASDGTDVTYEICVDNVTNNACPDGWTQVGANLEFTAYGLDPLTSYYWQVRAVNSTGKTQATGDWWRFTTEGPPGPFSKSTPASGATNQPINPTLSWTPSSGTNITYQVCYDTTNDNACAGNAWSSETANTSLALSGLSYGTTYYWQVRAQNSAGTVLANSATPQWWSFSTRAISANSNFMMDENTTLTETLPLTAHNPALVTFTLEGPAPAGTLDLAGDGSFTYTPPLDFNGEVSFQYRITEIGGTPSEPYTATITVKPVAHAPQLEPIAPIVAKPGEQVFFTAVAYDPDQDSDTLVFALTGMPAGATFNPATRTFQWTAQWFPGQDNLYQMTLTVTDEDDNSASQIVHIKVDPLTVYLPIVIR